MICKKQTVKIVIHSKKCTDSYMSRKSPYGGSQPDIQLQLQDHRYVCICRTKLYCLMTKLV